MLWSQACGEDDIKRHGLLPHDYFRATSSAAPSMQHAPDGAILSHHPRNLQPPGTGENRSSWPLKPGFRVALSRASVSDGRTIHHGQGAMAGTSAPRNSYRLERLNGAIKRRTKSSVSSLDEAAITRLVGAILLEQNDEWAVEARRIKDGQLAAGRLSRRLAWALRTLCPR